MAALNAKQRAIYLSEAGMPPQAVAGILGVDLADVKALMTEAEPDVELASGGGGGFLAPAFEAIYIEFESDEIPENVDVASYADLAHLTAPTDAEGYLFTATFGLESKNGAVALIQVFATDAATFDANWNGDGVDDPLPTDWTAQLLCVSAEITRISHRPSILVAPGQEIALMRVGAAVGTPDSGAADAIVGISYPAWVPLG